MKKSVKKLTLALAAALLLTACNGNTTATSETTKDTSPAATTAAPTTTTTAAPSADDTTPSTVTQPEETTAADADAVTVSCLDFYGNMTDVPMTKNEYGVCAGFLDETYVRYSKGEYYTSETNPEMFDVSNYSCTAECNVGEGFVAKTGDKFGSLTISKAQSDFYGYEDENGVLGGNWMSHNAAYDGNVTLDGYVIYFTEDEYGVTVGDIMFLPLPDSLIANNVPIAQSQMISGAYMFMSENFDFAFYGDTQPFQLGNLMTDYADNAELNDTFDGSWNVKQATITLGNINIGASEQFGNNRSSAVIEALTLKN